MNKQKKEFSVLGKFDEVMLWNDSPPSSLFKKLSSTKERKGLFDLFSQPADEPCDNSVVWEETDKKDCDERR